MEHFPLPHILCMVEKTLGAKYFIVMDLTKGFWQLPLEESCKKYTAFITEDGFYEFNVLPFGLINAPEIFQRVRVMHKILNELKHLEILIYIDDLLVFGTTPEEALEKCKQIPAVCRKYKIRIKLSKCKILQTSVKYLGFEVDGQGYTADQMKVGVVKNLPEPTNKDEVRRILGLFGYYRGFIGNLAEIASPRTKLLSKKTEWRWTQIERSALISLKTALATRTGNHHFDPKCPTMVDTDASCIAIGAALQQQKNGIITPVLFASRKFNETESKWSTREREAFAVVWVLVKSFKIFRTHKTCELIDQVWTHGRRVYIPKTLQEETLIAYHFAPWGTHPSKTRTLARLKQTYFWPSMHGDVHRMCRNCLTCQRRARMKKGNYDIGSLNARATVYSIQWHST